MGIYSLLKAFNLSNIKGLGKFPLLQYPSYLGKLKFDSDLIFLEEDELGDLFIMSLNDKAGDP